jgi:hypothetical protein
MHTTMPRVMSTTTLKPSTYALEVLLYPPGWAANVHAARSRLLCVALLLTGSLPHARRLLLEFPRINLGGLRGSRKLAMQASFCKHLTNSAT